LTGKEVCDILKKNQVGLLKNFWTTRQDFLFLKKVGPKIFRVDPRTQVDAQVRMEKNFGGPKFFSK
jgi:hypothetical protein